MPTDIMVRQKMSNQKGLPQTLQEAIKYFSDEQQCIDS